MSLRVGVRGIILALGMTALVLSGTVCSVDNAGLSNTGQAGAGGAAGHAGAKGSGGGGGSPSGTGGSSTGGVAGAGSGGTVATGGAPATGGSFGTGGKGGQVGGTGGVAGGGGGLATGGSGPGGQTGSGGTGGTGATAGTGGSAGQVGTGGMAGGGGGGAPGTGGAGTGGTAGSGGTAGTGGLGGSTGGRGGHMPDCSAYPSGTSSMVPTDDKLHCYWAHGNQVGWDSAEAICENEGGTLVTILSSMENMLVLHIAMQANLFGFNVPVAIGATDGKAANDQSGSGDYAWVTGEAWDYQNWHQGEPSGNCTGCVGPGGGLGCSCDHWLMLASDGTWYDRNESTARPFVCEAIAK